MQSRALHAALSKLSLSLYRSDDSAYERHRRWRFFGECQCLFEERDGFGKQAFACGVERGQRLVPFDMRTTPGVKVDAGVGIDRLTGLFSSCAKALDCPSEGCGIHRGDVAGLLCLQLVCRAGFVKCGVVEDGSVATLSCDHREESFEGRTI